MRVPHSLLAFGAFLALASSAFATTVISVGPGIGAFGNEVIYAGFTTSIAYSDVSVAADVGGAGGSFTAYLTTAIGGSETAADQIAPTVTFTPGAGPEMDTLFSGLDLGAGTYYLVLDLGCCFNGFNTYWVTGPGGTIVTDAGVSYAGDGTEGSVIDGANPPASYFTVDNPGIDPAFQVTGNASSTPEPASISLFLTGGLAGLWLWKRRNLEKTSWA